MASPSATAPPSARAPPTPRSFRDHTRAVVRQSGTGLQFFGAPGERGDCDFMLLAQVAYDIERADLSAALRWKRESMADEQDLHLVDPTISSASTSSGARPSKYTRLHSSKFVRASR